MSKDEPKNKAPTRILWELDQASNIHNVTHAQKLANKIGSTYQATYKDVDLKERAKHHQAVNHFMQAKRNGKIE